MNLLILGKKGEAIQKDLQENLDESWEIFNWNPGESEEYLSSLLNKADIAITGSDALIYGGIFKFISSAKNLKLLQIPFAGVDWLNPNLIPKRLMVANASGHEIAMSEYIIGCIMSLSIDLMVNHNDFKSGSWERTGTLSDPKSMHGEVFGKTLGIIGYGQIGVETAIRAKSLGMKTYGLNRTQKKNTPKYLDWHGSTDKLDFILEESDFLVLACDLNKSTKGLINKKTLSMMKKTSYIINVARGDVCVEEDLFNSLKNKTIAGAAIDTWWIYPDRPKAGGKPEKEPRPSDFPFHKLDNVIMTPHNSAHTLESDLRRSKSILDNLLDFKKGKKPSGFVFYGNK
jgi:phosphoglycerate dehydrogenase-like enzyme